MSAKDTKAQQVSDLIDGELSLEDQQALTQTLADDADVHAQFERMQMISAAIRQNGDRHIDASSVANAVRAQLEDEPTILAPQKKRHFEVPRFALGTALAATVAAISVAIAPSLISQNTDTGLSEVETFAFTPQFSVPQFSVKTVAVGGEPQKVNSVSPLSEGRWKTLQPQDQAKLENYLFQHNEYAGRLGVNPSNAHMSFFNGKTQQD